MPQKSQHTRTAEISIEKKGYLKIKIIPGSIIDKEDALDNFLVIKNLSRNEKMLKLVDIRGNWKMTKQAKEISKKNISPANTIARAYIIDSFLTKLMFAFIRSFTRPKVPQEFFTDESSAIEWLIRQNE